jgi:hypothetical protein
MIKQLKYWLLVVLISSCATQKDIMNYGSHYQKYKDYKSLKNAVDLMPSNITTLQVRKILGDPIDNGFDYRYTVDSTGIHHCPIGAVFNIDSTGKISTWWVDEICE